MVDIKTLNGHAIVDEVAREKAAAPDWNQMQNKPTEMVGGDTLVWDGDITGKPIINMGLPMCKVADNVITVNDIAQGFSVTYKGQTAEITSDYYADSGIAIMWDLGTFVYAENEYGEVGVYFSEGVSSITIPGYTGFTTEKLKPEYLPEGMKVKPTWDDIGSEEAVFFDAQGTTFDADGYASITPNASPSIGDTVQVEFDGTMYACEVINFAGLPVVGDAELFNGGATEGAEPFAIGFESATSAIVKVLGATQTHSVKMTGVAALQIPDTYYSGVKVFYVAEDDEGINRLHIDAVGTMATVDDVNAVVAKKQIVVHWGGVFYAPALFVAIGDTASVTFAMESSLTELRTAYTAEYTAT